MKRLICLLLLQLPIYAQLNETDLRVQKDWELQQRSSYPKAIKPFEWRCGKPDCIGYFQCGLKRGGY
mgnify:CR=1 FL=1